MLCTSSLRSICTAIIRRIAHYYILLLTHIATAIARAFYVRVMLRVVLSGLSKTKINKIKIVR